MWGSQEISLQTLDLKLGVGFSLYTHRECVLSFKTIRTRMNVLIAIMNYVHAEYIVKNQVVEFITSAYKCTCLLSV